jgi:hypothetical protein
VNLPEFWQGFIIGFFLTIIIIGMGTTLMDWAYKQGRKDRD